MERSAAVIMNAENAAIGLLISGRMKKIECPDCAADWDMEIGPDEEMQPAEATAERIRIIEGEEEVEKMDMLLSLAITGGDYSWI